jgi:hypothetical protein
MLFGMAHLDVALLRKLMLTGFDLTEEEEDHLFHCPECLEVMVNATILHLEREFEPD